MTSRLLILSDTHIPKRARELPAPVWDAVEEADLVVHAGDWVSSGFLEELGRRSNLLVACYGNNDGPELRRQLPLVARTTVEEVRLAVIHETGAAAGREARTDARFPEVDLLIFGHSHIPWDSTTPKGLRLLNPGSPTDRRRQPHRTYLTVDIDGRNVRPVLHKLPTSAAGNSPAAYVAISVRGRQSPRSSGSNWLSGEPPKFSWSSLASASWPVGDSPKSTSEAASPIVGSSGETCSSPAS